MNHTPTLKQLQYLLKLNDTRNFRQAAELCHITQPSLTAAIQELENLLGLPVLDRSQRKKVVFTAFGEQVLKTARSVVRDMNALSEQAKMMSKPLSGPMRLGLIPTIAPYLLPQILPPLQKQFPDMDFQITEDLSNSLIEKLHGGKIDIAIMAFPFETPDLNQQIFFEEPFFCAANNNRYKKQKLKLGDLDNQNVLLLEDGHCLRDHALSACKLQDIHKQKSFSATSLQTLVQMVQQDYGITLLPEMVVQNGLIPNKVSVHAFQNPVPTRKIGAAWRKKDPLAQDLNIVIKHLKSVLISKG